MKKFLTPRNLLIALIISLIYLIFVNRAVIIRSLELKWGLEKEKDPTSPCSVGYIFSQKDCRCVIDSYRCEGLSKRDCEKNQNCFSFQRSGSCSCPDCESALEHQCLPVDYLF